MLLPSPGLVQVHLPFRSQISLILIITWLQCRSKTTYCDFCTVLTTGPPPWNQIHYFSASRSHGKRYRSAQCCDVFLQADAILEWHWQIRLTHRRGRALMGSVLVLMFVSLYPYSALVTASFCSSRCWWQDCHKCNGTHMSMFCFINSVNVGAHVLVTDFVFFPHCLCHSAQCWKSDVGHW